ncbi:MAG: LPS assembly lipoprotein LptE [bacterium]
MGRPGTASQGGRILSIGVAPFVNHTHIPGLDWIVTDAVINELSTWPGVKIKMPKDTDYTLSGEIIAYQSQIPNSYIDGTDESLYPLEYQLSMTLNFSLYKKGDKTPREIKNVLVRQPYGIVYNNVIREQLDPGSTKPDIPGSKHEEYKALSEALGRAVQSVMDRLFVMESGYVT